VDKNKLISIFKDTLSLDTMMGFTLLKPHGYAGDYELIGRIYDKYTSSNLKNKKWDLWYHSAVGANAVRNRKEYFKNQLDIFESEQSSVKVLNLASGPCSDLLEFLQSKDQVNTHFDCLDLDKNAIEYASNACAEYSSQITFIHKNAFRYKPNKKYHLIWSAGLFDYFNDKLFIELTKRMYLLLDDNGELVIGNFSPRNSGRGLMEVLLDWHLNHRTEEKLISLAVQAGIPEEKLFIGSEENKVNLFLHAKK